jgi:hypothetical protein
MLPYRAVGSSFSGQYRWHFRRLPSIRPVVITMHPMFCSHIIRQKSSIVFGSGPCAAMYRFAFW